VHDLPPSICKHLGVVADRHERFTAGCIGERGVPADRFLVASRREDTIIVAIEHGGFDHYWDAKKYFLDEVGNIVAVDQIERPRSESTDSSRR
jgi:hypothetical protein